MIGKKLSEKAGFKNAIYAKVLMQKDDQNGA